MQKCINPTLVVKINIQSTQEDPNGKKAMLSKEPSNNNSMRDTTKNYGVTGCWNLRFDGSKSKDSARAGFELIILKR